MKIGITGLSNSGKTTLFNALTGLSHETQAYANTSGEPALGVVKVPDVRILKLSEIYRPKKTTPSTVQYVDYIGLTRGDRAQNRKVLEFVKDADALLHVVRGFEDEAVVHPLGCVNPLYDAMALRTELLLADLELVERRLESIELESKKGRKPGEAERGVLLKCQEALEAEKPLRTLSFSDEELLTMRHLQFMTLKPEVLVLNVPEGMLGTKEEHKALDELRSEYAGSEDLPIVSVCAKAEMEIAHLETADRAEFLNDLGIDEPACDRLIRVSYGRVGLISFFTVGEDEVRAWAIQEGTDALRAAGKIHSDIQRGFIRAEVVAYEDFMASGGEMTAAKSKGLVRLEGKTYAVKDGDIMLFRFNV